MPADQPGSPGDESPGNAPRPPDHLVGWAAHGSPAAGLVGPEPTDVRPTDGDESDGASSGNESSDESDDPGDDDPSDDDPSDEATDGKKKRRWSNDGCRGCDGVDCGDWNLGCDLPGCDLIGCHLMLPGLTLLLAAAAVLPERGAGWLVRALIASYRRHLTRLTPACPQTPSCSEYALTSVATLGVRRGLAAAHRIRGCGQPAPASPAGAVS